MARPHTYTTIRKARTLRERHPDASASIAHVALVMATFANGPSGTMIRPTLKTVADLTGLHHKTVQDAVKWLEEQGELRRDKQGWRGSAACFTYVGGSDTGSDAADSSQPEQPAADPCSHCHVRPVTEDGFCGTCLDTFNSGDADAFARLAAPA